MGPTECKYCGCREIRSETDSAIHFKCFSSYWHDGDEWNIATNCAAKCAVQLVELRERVQRAVAVLEGAERFDCEALDGSTCRERHDGGGEVDADIVDQVIEILKGNYSKSSNSSPITTDDLAASDYFEAVRQRVPWMVAVKHIEGLVEGYRRCGVMVWQTAEEIRKVHEGEYEQAD